MKLKLKSKWKSGKAKRGEYYGEMKRKSQSLLWLVYKYEAIYFCIVYDAYGAGYGYGYGYIDIL